MIRFRGTIEYLDGRLEPWEAGGAVQAEWEAYAARHDFPLSPTPEVLSRFPVTTWRLFLAYASLGLEEGFDTWRRTISDVELDGDSGELVPPTLPEAIAAP